VVGGRVQGPGVGGFSLGGGYSWFSNQYGLTCDTVQAFNLVLPNGTITQVESAQSDLFFALKGGLNRFGVVTSIVFKTKPQTNVYGGLKFYGTDAIPALINATSIFQNQNTDPKAQVILTLNSGVAPGAILLLFYDGPNEPAAFAPYDSVDTTAPPLISEVNSQTYESFSQVTPSDVEAGYRGAFHTMMTTSLTTGFLNAVANESTYYGDLAVLHSGSLISYDAEPFGDYGAYATDSAFPHANSPLPLNLYFSWTSETEDEFWRGIMQQSIDYLTEVAKAEGIFTEDAYAYPNYALDTYTGPQLYGPTNAARLREIQTMYDPNGVMQLAGGFTF
jgi:hypothetical protein